MIGKAENRKERYGKRRIDLRPLSPNARRTLLEKELGADLSALSIDSAKLGHADERNCEQMFGHVPIPVGYAGPLPVTFSSGETADIHLPLATTEGALVASVNRGCKALRLCGGVKMESVYHGVSRSLALKIPDSRFQIPGKTQNSQLKTQICERAQEWIAISEATSNHLKILKYDIDVKDNYIFITIYADTDEAMGMNMVTIAAEAIGKWLEQNIGRCVTPSVVEGQRTALELVAVAANVDSDKKPSRRTHDRGRGYEVTATATVPIAILTSVLKTSPEALLDVAHAKLAIGSDLAGALGRNCHAANIIAALYLATGQDPAHVVEGSLADTIIGNPKSEIRNPKQIQNSKFKIQTPAPTNAIIISIRLPSLMVGIRGGGTTLPAQSQALKLLLHSPGPRTKDLGLRLHPCRRLAESIGAAVLAGELSLLAALSSHHLAQSHAILARR